MKGHIETRGKNLHKIILEVGRGPDGKRQRRTHTFHGTKRQAEAELNRLLCALEGGTYVDGGRVSVSEYLSH